MGTFDQDRLGRKGMKLYWLKAKEDTLYLSDQNMVVRAQSEQDARALAAERDVSERWMNDDFATCEELLQEGDAGVIIEDNNGA